MAEADGTVAHWSKDKLERMTDQSVGLIRVLDKKTGKFRPVV